MNTPNEEEVLMQTLQEILDTMNTCIENKSSDELELVLGDENMGDNLILTFTYSKNKNKTNKNKDMMN